MIHCIAYSIKNIFINFFYPCSRSIAGYKQAAYKLYKLAAGKTAKSILISCGARLAPFDIQELRDLTRYGMSDEFDMVALETVNNQYLGGDTSLACSAQTQREIDQKVVELVRAQHQKAIQILTDNRQKLDELAKYLYQKETITGDEFMEILERE